MRIATFNMRGGGSAVHWAELHERARPDLVFAQETRDPASFPGDLFAPPQSGDSLWRPVPHGKWGSALRVPGGVSEVPLPGFGGWVVGGAIRVGATEALAFSVHLPAPYLVSANRLLDALRPRSGGLPMLLAGDWNLVASRRPPDSPRRDTPGELRILARLEDELGLVSAWSSAHPGKAVPQTLRWARNRDTPYHCDGIFLPKDWVSGIDGVSVLDGEPWERLSDHNPVVASIELGASS